MLEIRLIIISIEQSAFRQSQGSAREQDIELIEMLLQ
jgi:hypothetical protein